MGVEIELFECYAKKALQKCEGKTNDVFVAFIGYVKDLNKLLQSKASAQKSHHRFQCPFQSSWQ